MATPGPARNVEPRATPSEIVCGLDHPLRRSILRLLLKKGPATSKQMAARMKYVTTNGVRFHLDNLVGNGLARKERSAGDRASVYSPTKATRIPWVATVLRLTAEED